MHRIILTTLSLTLYYCMGIVLPVYADTVYDRVLKTGKIRAGYICYQPTLMKDTKTKRFSGIGFDVLALAAHKLSLKLEMTEEVAIGTMIEGLKTNRYDIVALPVWANASRAKAADFSHPLYYSAIYAYTKSGDNRIDSSLKNLNSSKFKVATIDGEMNEMIAHADFPKAQQYSLPQLADASELLLSVASRKADITFAEPNMVFHFNKQNPKSVQNITPQKPLRVFPNVFMFNVGEEKFKAMLNTTLDEISNSGELESIIHKYEPFPKAFIRLAPPFRL